MPESIIGYLIGAAIVGFGLFMLVAIFRFSVLSPRRIRGARAMLRTPDREDVERVAGFTVLTKVTIASISVYQYNAREMGQDEVLQPWKEEGPRTLEGQGYRITGLRELSGPGRVFCIEMNRQVEMFEVKCVFDVKRLMADYYGEDSEIHDFYSFITAAQNSDMERR